MGRGVQNNIKKMQLGEQKKTHAKDDAGKVSASSDERPKLSPILSSIAASVDWKVRKIYYPSAIRFPVPPHAASTTLPTSTALRNALTRPKRSPLFLPFPLSSMRAFAKCRKASINFSSHSSTTLNGFRYGSLSGFGNAFPDW